MRLIDADELLLMKQVLNLGLYTESHSVVFTKDIEKAKTIDAVPVVRCKDCIYYGDVGDCSVHPHDGRLNMNYFCADGERKMNNQCG